MKMNQCPSKENSKRFLSLFSKIFLFLLILCIYSISQSPGVSGAEPPPDYSQIDCQTVRDFKVFFEIFKTAVKEKDEVKLKKMMDQDFFYSFGSTQTGPDNAIKYMNEYKLWASFEKILDKGYRFDKERNMYVCPPEYAKPDSDYMGYRTGFELQKGYWRCIFFVVGD